MLLCGETLRYSFIKQCRLTALATPTASFNVDVVVSLVPNADGYTLQASIADERQTYMIIKGQLDKA